MKRSLTPPPQLMAAIAGLEPLFKLQGYGITVQPLNQADTAKISRNEQKWLSPRDIEEQFSIGRWSIYRLIRSGSLKSSKLSRSRSGKVLVDAESLKQYLASKEFIPKPMTSIKTRECEKGLITHD